MSKQKISFSCNSCNYQTLKWMGCCPECKEWNSFEQNISATTTIPGAKSLKTAGSNITMMQLNQVEAVAQSTHVYALMNGIV